MMTTTSDNSASIDPGASRRVVGRILLLTFFAVVLDGFDSQALGFALPALIREWGLSKAAFAPVLSISLIGMTLGSATAGAFGDRWGRKVALTACVAVFGIMTALSAAAADLTQLSVLRFVAAAGLGGAMPNAAALIGESTPRRWRSVAISAIAVCVPVGGVLGGLVSAALLEMIGWRGLFLVAGLVPLAYAVILLVGLPESSSFLMASHRRAKAEAPPPVGPATLFRADLRRDTIALACAFFFCLLNVYACFNWLPTLIVDGGQDLAVASLGLTLFNVGGVVAAIGGGWAAGRYGSRWPLVAMFTSAGILGIVLTKTVGHIAPMFLVLTLLGAAIAGAQSVLTAVAAQIYPVELRSTGVGLTIGLGRLGGIASAFIGALAISMGGIAAFGMMLAIAAAAGLLAVFAMRRHSAAVGAAEVEERPEGAPYVAP